jgi:hypothetical protein
MKTATVVLVAILIASAALLTGCLSAETQGAAFTPGQSLCSFTLRKDVHKSITMAERALHGTPHGTGTSSWLTPIIVDTKVVERPQAQGGAWKEKWTVRRSGYHVYYTVSFVPSPKGGTDFSLTTPPEGAR